MGHLQTIESELRQLIATGDTEALVSWVKERILESYRNGQAVRRGLGQSPAPVSSAAAKRPARSSAPSNLPV